ncbi:phosphoribosyltransferase family protein [candidate division CSSED10-310 bacterium]|uniref:Phosphoribosyltransferase family protein n=1 Tax=candidate division CSSED10-310 bacterium TaxID=2855610 RepID=A0ABV6YWL2_UNCC1
MKRYLRRIDRNTAGNRYDITPLFSHFADFNALVDDLVASLSGTEIDLVAGIDALGFILGTALAQKLKVGIMPVRKGGKLPVESDRIAFRDYTGQTKELEIRRDVLCPGTRVLIVDEWIETGAQVTAAISLIEGCGALVAGIATINMDVNNSTEPISSKYKVHAVWERTE